MADVARSETKVETHSPLADLLDVKLSFSIEF